MGITGKLLNEDITDILNGKIIKCFLETGTYHGDSTFEASKMFDKVYTIELVENLYNMTKDKWLNDENYKDNISFHLGDSLELLPEIVKEINKDYNSSCVYFIDAHQSGNDTSHSIVCVPLLLEIELILQNMETKENNVFIFDDVRLFDNYWDWKGISIESIQNLFKKYDCHIKEKYIMNDRYIVVL
jgi:hypothetical protein